MVKHNQLLRVASGALKVPASQNLGSVKLWCEYAIWGLLFYDDQSPWLAVIECLQICFYRKGQSLPLFEGLAIGSKEHEPIVYGIELYGALRHLLFRDREALRIAETPSGDDRSMGRAWLETVGRDHGNLELGYLQQAFDSFRDFARAIELLRTAEIEAHTEKRWTSRHLLPLGPAMTFPDVSEQFKLDRKFMRRTGEMLYLMLNRSARWAEVSELVGRRLLGIDGVWNKLAHRLGGPPGTAVTTSQIGYLPMPSHPSYDLLAEDWIAILSLGNVPVENALDPLERVSGLMQVIYIVQRARDVMGDDAPATAPFFLDVVGGPGSNPLRKLSMNQYHRHRTLPLDATESFIDAFEASDEWKAVLDSDAGAKEASDLLGKRFLWAPRRSPDPDSLPDPGVQLAELRAEAQSTRGHHVGAALTNHGKQIGLLRAQRSSGTWYSPNDAFLEALVLANVTRPMEFSEFLNRLMVRYNIVIGAEEARAAFGVGSGPLPAPHPDLKENERMLEERLRGLGFLERKSDDCAFVINPFIVDGRVASGEPHRVYA